MTLDEAIKHCEEKAKEQREKATAIARAKEPFYKYAECAECAKEHEQLAEWLKELKAYKERPQGEWIRVDDNIGTCFVCDHCGNKGHVSKFCSNCGAKMKGGAE